MDLRKHPLRLAAALLVFACGESHTGVEDAAIVFDPSFPDTGVDAGLPPTNVGATCDEDADCDGPAQMCVLGWGPFAFPAGYCTSSCLDATECPDGSSCVSFGSTSGLCLLDCNAASVCPSGLGCSRGGRLPPVCLPGCDADADCAEGLTCNPDAGVLGEGSCYDPVAPLGGTCAGDDDCPTGAFCATESEADYPGGACVTTGCDAGNNTGCPDDAQCLPQRFGSGICFDGCDSNEDCREGYECDNYGGRKTCQPAFVPENLGQVCSGGRGSCAGGLCLTETESGFPDSYCVALDCDPSSETSTCPGDGVCVEAVDGTGVCLDGCTVDEDCRDAYRCRASDPKRAESPRVCLPGCRSNADCSAVPRGSPPYACNPGTGYCGPPFDSDDLGEPCLGDGSDCFGGRCLNEEDNGWPAGTCTYPGCDLTGVEGGASCPTGSVCVDDQSGDPAQGVCVPSCTLDADVSECRPGYACIETSPDSGKGGCQPSCGDDDCEGGRTCDTNSGRCKLG